MKHFFKRCLAVFLLLALLLPVIGCGSDAGAPEGASEEQTLSGSGSEEETSNSNGETETVSDGISERPGTSEEARLCATCGGVCSVTVLTPATTFEEGERNVACADCGAEETERIPATGTLKVLAIGNSFSVDGMEYLWDICRAGGVETVVLGNLYIGGCTLNTHWTNIAGEKRAYTYYKNTNGTWTKTDNVSVQTALKQESWDVITVQQASGSSGKPDTYGSLSKILDHVETNKTNPTARILWHMTWAYQGDSDHSAFSNYNSDQATMYQAIVDTVEEVILPNTVFDGVIPSGTAIQNLRTSYVGDTVTRDGYHLHKGIGRYTAAMTWFAAITGRSLETIEWVPDGYRTLYADLPMIRQAVTNAIKTPYAVTASSYTEEPRLTDADLLRMLGLDPDGYELLELEMVTNAYYNSPVKYELYTTGSTAQKYNASRYLTREELPVGSVILVDDGYQYRPEAWVSADSLTSPRPGVVTATSVLVTEEWWGSYTIRAFNLSYVNASGTMTEADSVHLRIYVPKDQTE